LFVGTLKHVLPLVQLPRHHEGFDLSLNAQRLAPTIVRLRMLLPSSMSWAAALCRSPEHFFKDLVRRSDHSRVSKLLASDQAPVNSLP